MASALLKQHNMQMHNIVQMHNIQIVQTIWTDTIIMM